MAESVAESEAFLSSIPCRSYNLQQEMQKMQMDLQGDPYFDIANSWLKKKPQAILPVWNQGPIGACYGFPTTDAASALHVINGGEPVSLSKQEFIDELHKRYNHSHDSSPDNKEKQANKEMKEKGKQEIEEEQGSPAKKKKRIKGDEKQEIEEEQGSPAKKEIKGKEKQDKGKEKRARIPSNLHFAFSMMEDFGLYEEEVYPYKAVKDESAVTPMAAVDRGRKFFILDFIAEKYKKLSKVETEVLEALEHQPVVGVMELHRSLRKFTGQGVYRGKLRSDVRKGKKRYHCVLILGSGTDENGEEFFLIKNSWGTGWGHKGFAKVSRSLILEYGLPVGTTGFRKVNRMGRQVPSP